jgi:hypothetical protein
MEAINPTTPLVGPQGPVSLLDAFEGRRQLVAYYFMWHPGRPAAEQCEGCTWNNTQVAELSYLHSRGITYAVLPGPYDQSARYRDFMGWDLPWYSAQPSLDTLLVGRRVGTMHLVCYLRDGGRVFETYWTTGRGVEAVDYSYALMDLTAYGRQEPWEDSPPGWPQPWQVDGSNTRTNGRPTAQWSRLEAGAPTTSPPRPDRQRSGVLPAARLPGSHGRRPNDSDASISCKWSRAVGLRPR